MAAFYDPSAEQDDTTTPAPAPPPQQAATQSQPFYAVNEDVPEDDTDTSTTTTPPTTGGSDTASSSTGTDTTTPPPTDGDPNPPTQPPMTPPPAPQGTAGYTQWQQSMTAAGYTADQIAQMYSQQYDASGRPIGGRGGYGGAGGNGFYDQPPYPYDYGDSDPGTGYVGQNQPPADSLNDWNPGQVYTGNDETPLEGDGQTFTPDDSTVDAADDTHAVNWDVTEEQTVQGQMNQITQNMSTNPVFQSLAASLERAQAAHGGENSLMAETAAYNGVVGMAFQIASADAATYARSAEFNASTANQFALSNRQFMQQALLSTQNYQQSQVLQDQQIQGNLRSVSMQIAGTLQNTQIGANAQIASSQIGAAAQRYSADAQRAAAAASAAAELGAARIQQQTALSSIQANFESQWTLNEQQQGHSLELSDRQTDNSIRHDIIAGNQQFGQQMTLQMNADNNANLRQLMGGISQIGSTPGLTGEQQANATNQLTQMYHTNANMGASFYGSSGYGLSSGASGANVTGNTAGFTPMNAGTPGGPVGTTPSYDQYGDYLSYGQGGYTMFAPPVTPFYGGTGLTTSQGGIPMYGSNTDFEASTGNSVDYNNQLTGSNPLGNRPGQTTGGANYTGFLPPEEVGGP